MNEINTLINFGQTWMASHPETIEEERLKSLCLYNDHIILSVDNDMATAFKESIANEFKIDMRKLNATFLSIEEISTDRQIYVSIFDSKNIEEFLGRKYNEEATRLFMEAFAKEKSLSLDKFMDSLKDDREIKNAYFKEIYYSKLSVISSLSIYQKINAKIPCSLTGFSKSESYILTKCIETNTSLTGIPSSNLIEEIDYIIPSLKKISWSEIFELRTDKRVKSFKDWINGNTSEIEKEGLKDLVFQELWEVMGQLKPNILKNSIKATIGNLPLPFPINPASIVAESVDLYKNIQFNRKYAWLLFLYDIRSKAE